MTMLQLSQLELGDGTTVNKRYFARLNLVELELNKLDYNVFLTFDHKILEMAFSLLKYAAPDPLGFSISFPWLFAMCWSGLGRPRTPAENFLFIQRLVFI